MAEDEKEASPESAGFWWLTLPLGIVLIQYAEELARPGQQPYMDYLYGCISIAVGLWLAPEALETLAERPGSPLRRFAGAGRAFFRPALALFLLAFAARRGLQLSVAGSFTYIGLASGYLFLALSSYMGVRGWPLMLVTWRSVGALKIKVDGETAAPGGVVTASLEMNRPCRDLKAALVLYDSASKADDGAFGRFEGAVSPALERNGVWTARVAVAVPDDAPPSLEGKEGDEAWRYWELEVVANGATGHPVTRTETVEIA